MKVKRENIAKNKMRVQQRMSVSFILLVLCIILFVANIVSTVLFRQTVEVVAFDHDMYENVLISSADMKKVEISKKEYKSLGTIKLSDGTSRRSVVLWSEKDELDGAYTTHYSRADSPVYWDGITKTAPTIDNYLYGNGNEVAILDIDLSSFGELIIPGDKITIRVAYQDTLYNLPNASTYQTMNEYGISASTTTTVNKTLMSEVKIVDMLNSSGKSILNIYNDFLQLSSKKQKEKLADSSFLESTKPAKIIVTPTTEELDMLNYIKTKSPQYTISLIPRTGNNNLIEALTSNS